MSDLWDTILWEIISWIARIGLSLLILGGAAWLIYAVVRSI